MIDSQTEWRQDTQGMRQVRGQDNLMTTLGQPQDNLRTAIGLS